MTTKDHYQGVVRLKVVVGTAPPPMADDDDGMFGEMSSLVSVVCLSAFRLFFSRA